ncbi:MAG: hypothetical protein WCI43_01680, partial [Candidatus Firestonebacteria bacterium]
MRKLLVFLSLLLPLSLSAAIELEPSYKKEAEEMLSQGLRNTQRIQLKIEKYTIFDVKQDNPAVAASAEDKARGFIAFNRHYMYPVYFNSNPAKEELNLNNFELQACQGEREPFTVGLVALEDCSIAVGISEAKNAAGEIIKSSAFDIRTVKHLLKSVDS